MKTMKFVKKLMLVLVAAMMVLSTARSLRAEEETTSYTITINNAENGEVYTAYKLMDATYVDDDDVLDEDSQVAYYYQGEETDALYVILAKYFQFEEFVDGKAYVKVVDGNGDPIDYSDVDVSKLAAEINENMTTLQLEPAAEGVEAANGKAEIEVPEKGYYFVDTTLGSLCAIDTAANVEVYEKNSIPTMDKQVREDHNTAWYNDYDEELGDGKGISTADRNQNVTFVLTIDIGTNEYASKDENGVDGDYDIIDLIPEGMSYVEGSADFELTNKDGLAVDVEDGDVSVEYYDEYPVGQDTLERVLYLYVYGGTVAKLGQEGKIVFKYMLTVDEDAPIRTALINTAYLNYGRAGKTKEVTTTVKTYGFNILKTDKDGNPLGGVEFALSREGDEATEYFDTVKNKWVEADDEGKFPTFFASKSGTFGVNGIDADTYQLIEVEALPGYVLADPIEVVIDEEGNVKADGEKVDDYTVTIVNFSGTVLPSTGGIGTTIFHVAGALLVLGAGIVLISKKRANNN